MHLGWTSSTKSLGAALALAALLALAPRPTQAQAVPWWSASYSSSRQVTLTSGTRAIPAGSVVSVTFNHAAIVAESPSGSLASGNDVRLAYRSGGVVTEIPRTLAFGSAWNSATTKLMFKTQTLIPASSSDGNYFLYYGNPAAAAPAAGGVPSARSYKVEQPAEQSTTSLGLVNIPGTTLTFTPGQASETWLIFATGVLRSDNTGDLTSEMSLQVNGAEVDHWGQKNNSAATPNGSGFLIFHRITGASTLQTVQLQFLAAAGTTFASNLRVVAVLLPQGSDFQFAETPGQILLGKNVTGQAVQTLTFTPSSAGDYYIFGKTTHSDPGGGTVQSWVDDDQAVPVQHPDSPADVHYSNRAGTLASMSVAFRRTLPASSRTFTLRGTTGGNNGSIWQFRRLMAFRADAWEAQDYVEDLAQATTSTILTTKSTLTTAAPPAARDYLVLQMARMSGDNVGDFQKSGILVDGGATILRTDHHINLGSGTGGYHHVAAVANVKNTAGSVVYQNRFQSSVSGRDVDCAESVILALRYHEPTVTQRPVVRELNSASVDKAYGIGQALSVQVVFSEKVNVVGTPQLTLETGAADVVLSYSGVGSGTNTLTFNYTVLAGDTSPDLDVVGTGSFSLSGATIRDFANLDADILLPAPGTPGSLSANRNLVIDGFAPSATGTPSGAPNPSLTGNFTVTWTAATDVGGAGTGAVTYTVDRSTDGGLTWPTTFTGIVGASLAQAGLADGSYVYRVQAVDLALNPGPVSAVSAAVLVDKTAPTVTSIALASADPTNAASVNFTVTFSEPVQNVGATDFSVATTGTVGGTSIATVTGGPTVYTVTVNTGTGSGTLRLDVPAAATINDLPGNALAGLPYTAGAAYTVDKAAPTVTSIVRAGGDPTNAASVGYTVTFSEPVQNVGAADFSVATTGTVGSTSIATVTGGPTVYTVTVNTGTGSGTLRLDVPAGATVNDLAGNPLVGLPYTGGEIYTIDKTAPTVVSIVRAGGDPTNAASVSYTVTFSESVQNVGTADFSVAMTGSVAGASVTGVTAGPAAVYTVTANTGSGSGTLRLDIPAGATVNDLAGNALGSLPFTGGQVYTLDKTGPTVSSIVLASANPTSAASVNFTVTFNEAVTGVAAGTFALTTTGVSGASIGTPTGSGTTWTVPVNTGSGSGTIRLDATAAGTTVDLLGNPLGGLPFTTGPSYTVDKSGPGVTLSTSVVSPTNAAPFAITATFTEAVTGFAVGDISVTGGSAGSFVAVNGTTYTFTVTPSSTLVTVNISVAAGVAQDLSSNANTASNILTINYDAVVPTVAMSSAAPNLTNTSPIPVTVTFSESVVNFTSADIATANGTVSGFAGSGAVYTFNLTPSGQGLVTADIAAGAAQDAAGNNNTAAPQFSRTYDTAAPTVAMSSTALPATNTSPIPVTVTFSESVTGFTIGDIVPGNATVSGFAGSGAAYTFNLTPTAQGAVTATIAAGVAQDLAGNNNIAAPPFSITYDTAAPTVAMTSTAPASTNLSPIPVTVTFSESVLNFTVADIVAGNATVSGFAGSGAIYTFNLAPIAQGTVTADIAAGAAQDAAGNNSTAAAQLSRIYDTAAPGVSMSSATLNPTNTSPIPVTVTFTESVTGFTAADITTANGTVSGFAGSGTTYTFNLTPSAQGLVTATIAAGAAQDAAGNNSTAATPFSRTYDSAGPSVVLTTTSANPTNVSPIPVTVTFSEAVTGFSLAGVTVTGGTAGSFVAVNGTTYTYAITPALTQVTVTTTVVAGAGQDLAANGNTVSNTLTVDYNAIAPTVAMSSVATPSTNVSPIPVSVTFSVPVVNFTASDIVPGNATVSGFAGSGAAYTFNLVPSGQGLVTADIAAGVAQDTAGNGNTSAPQFSRTYDTVAPTVAMSSGASDPTNTSPIPVTVTFNETVSGFTAADIVPGNATISGFAGSGAVYTFNLTPIAQGAVTASIAAGAAQDLAGNNSTAAAPFSRIFDTVAPTVAMSSATPNPTNTSPIPVTVTFSEAVTGFTVADIVPGNATVSNFAGSGAVYTFDLTPSAQGLVTADIAAGAAQDGAGNNSTAAAQFQRSYDSSAPSVVMSSVAPDPTKTSPIPVSVTFSEAVTGFTAASITATNGTVAGFAGSGAAYSFNLVPSGQGLVTANIPAGAAQDGVGNLSTAAVQFSRLYDSVAPGVVMTSPALDPTTASPIPVTVTFSEAVTGFTSAAIVATNGAVSGFAGSGAVYTFNLTPSAQGLVSADIAAGVAQDAAANLNTAAPTFSRTFDTVGPSVVLSSGALNPTNASPIPVTVTFSEAVVGFTASDIVAGNAGVSGFAGSGAVYTFNLTPSGQGLVTADIAAGVAQDTAGNGNSAAVQFSRIFDSIAPTVAMSSAVPNPTNTSPIPITITFSEAVTGFSAAGITATNGSVSGFAGSGAVYTFNLTPTAQGLVTADIAAGVAQDAAGNLNTAAPQFSRNYDNSAPGVAMTSGAPNPTNASPIAVTVTFSEPVLGFTSTDIVPGNATVSGFAGSGAVYSFNLTPSGQGLVTADIAAGAAQDGVGNLSTAALQFSRTYDSVSPSVVMSSATLNPTNTSPIPVTVTFSESVTGFTAASITATNGSVSGFAGSGAVYSFNLTPSAQGLVTANIAAGVVQDAAGNLNTAAPAFSRTYDSAAPSVAMTSGALNPTNASPIAVTVTFSEPVTGFTAADIVPGNATVSGFAGSGAAYSFNLTPIAQGTVTADIPAGAAQDGVGNLSTAAPQFSRTFDNGSPSVAMTSLAPNPTNTSPIAVSVTFSEPVTGFVAGSILASNGTVSGFAGSGANYTFNLTPTAQGVVTADIAAGVAQDAAGNSNTAAAQFSRTYDSSAPGVAMTSVALNPTKVSPIPVTVTFSEPVVGFTVTDIVPGNATVSGFAGSGAVYSFNLTPIAQGLVTADIAAGAAQDGVGNPSTAAPQFSRTYDSLSPSVAMNSVLPDPTGTSPIPVTVTFSESVTGFTAASIVATNGSVSGFAGGGASYSFNLTPSAQGLVTANIAAGVAQDAAGNLSTAAPAFSRTYDTTSPAVVLTTSASSPTNGSPIPVTATFSEPVTGFTLADVTVSGGTAGGFVAVNGTTYTYTVTPASTQVTVTTNIAAGAAQDTVGNNNTASNLLTIDYDAVAPTVAMSSASPNPTKVSPIPVTVTFSESVTGFTAASIVPTNASISGFAGAGASYSFNLTPTGQGAVSATIAAGVAQDAAGNLNTAAAPFTRVFDSVAPSVAMASGVPNPTNTTPIPVTVTFSESVTGFTAASITATNGTVSGFAGSGASYSFNLTPTAQGVVTANIAAGVAQDAAGNLNTAALPFTRTFDSAAPTVAMSSATLNPTNTSPIPVTVTFSEPVTGFTAASIVAGNGTVSGFAGGGASYSFNLTPTAQGLVTADIAAGAAQDGVGNPSTAAPQFSRTYDSLSPSVAMSSALPNPTNTSPIPVTVTFSESVTGFTAASITTANGTVSGFAGSGASYSFNLTPTAQGVVTATIAAGVAQDAAGNPNTAAPAFSRTYDSSAPTVAMSSAVLNPTNVSPIPVTVTFSESVTGFTAASITPTNGAVSGFAGSGAVYTFNLTPSGQGAVSADIAAGVAQDSAGNLNTAAPQFLRTYDSLAPSVAMSSALPNPTNTSPIPVTVTFSESVTGFTAASITTSNGSVSGFAGSGAVYTFNLTPTAQGVVTANIAAGVAQDAAGNASTAAAPFSRTYDSLAPSVAMSSALPNPTNTSPIPVTVTFSESVTGFTAASITATNGTVSGFAGSGAAYTFNLTPTAQGTVTAAIAAGVAQDAAGNLSTAAAPFSRTYDSSSPSVAMSSAAPNPTNTSPIPVTVTFSEPVTGFTALSITATNGSVAGFAGSGAVYTFNLTPTAQGVVTATIAAGVAQDAAGNPNTAAPAFTRTYDSVAPTVTSITRAGADPTSAASVGFTVTFSKPVLNVDAADFSLTTTGAVSGASVSGVAAGPTVWTVTVNTGSGSGTIRLDVPITATINDSASNALTGLPFTAGQVYTVDKTPPTVTSITRASADPTNAASVNFSVGFSEPVTGVAAATFTLTTTGVSGASIGTPTGSGTTWTVPVNTGTGSGTIRLDATAAGTTVDLLGNALSGLPFATGQSYTVDKTAPTVTSIVRAGATPTNAATVSFTVTFSEPVTGVDAADFALVTAGVSGAALGAVTGSGDTWTVAVSTGSGDGTIQLNLAAVPTVQDLIGNSLTAPFTTGQVYTLDRTPPSLLLSGPSAPTATTGPVSYTVTYSGADTVTLSAGDVTLIPTGTATGSVGVSGSGTATRTVTISGITGNGTLALSIAAGTASDQAGNSAPAAGPSAGVTVNNAGTIALPNLLQVETLTNPMLVGRSPAFSALHNWTGPIPSDAVSFRAQVSTNSSFSTITHWNSPSSATLFPGSVSVPAGARSPEIRYGTGGNQSGAVPLLTWNQQYFWRVEFRDALGDASGFSTESATFRMVSPSAIASANGNGSPSVAGYRYVGFPIAVGTTLPASLLLSQSAGGYRWDEPTRNWFLLSGFDLIEGGRGYIVWTGPGAPLTISTGQVAQGDQAMNFAYTTLGAATGAEIVEGQPANAFAGAHFVVNPFNAPISWDDPSSGGQVEKPNTLATYRKYDGTQYILYNSTSHSGLAGPTIYPFQAFGINVASDNGSATDIIIHEPPSTSFISAKSSMAPVAAGPNAWALNIVASSGTALDSENILGVNPNAEDEWDPRDALEPGHAADTWVLLYFSHNDWALHPHDYTHDFRKTRLNSGDEIVWTGTVKTNSAAPVTLSWPNHGQMPTGDWQYFIEDPAAGTSINMSSATSIQIGPLTGPATVVIRARRVTSAAGTLAISATPGGPAPTTAAPGTSTVPMMAFDVLASGETITLQQLVVHHQGTGDPSKVQVSLYNGTTRIAGPSSFDAGATVVWGGLGQVLAGGAAQTWGIAYDFAADSAGTYRAALYGGEIEGVGSSSGLTITPGPALLESSEVTVTSGAGTASSTGGSTGGGGGGGGSCGLLGVEFIGVAALLWMKRRVGGRRRAGA